MAPLVFKTSVGSARVPGGFDSHSPPPFFNGVHGQEQIKAVVGRLARWRWWVQGGFLLAWLDPWMIRMHTVCSPVFHCYSCPLATFACPIGVLANFSALHMFPFIVVGMLVAVAPLLAASCAVGPAPSVSCRT